MPKLQAGQYLRADDTLVIRRNLLETVLQRETVEVQVLAAGIENVVLLHTAQGVVSFLLLRIPQHLSKSGIGNRFNNEIAHAPKVTVVGISPRRRIAPQYHANVRLSYLHSFAGRLFSILHRQDKTGFQIDEIRNVVRAQIPAQEVQKPIVKLKLPRVGRWFGLQSAVIPFIADVHVWIRVLIPLDPILF